MADPSRDPSSTAGPIQPMLARLRGTVAALPPAEEPRKVPSADIPMATPVTSPPSGIGEVPVAQPVDVPLARPVTGEGPPAEAAPAGLVQDRYAVGELLSRRGEVRRYRAVDQQAGTEPVPVTLLRAPLPALAEPVLEAEQLVPESDQAVAGEEILPSFEGSDTVLIPPTYGAPIEADWPSIAWERTLLERAQHASLPRVGESLVVGEDEYLVEELPRGRPLREAWDDPEATDERRFGWLKQVAEALHRLHQQGAVLESLDPDSVVIAEDDRARLTDLSGLLPLPVPADAAVRATPATAPELLLSPEQTDARCDLYALGALVYSLYVGRALTEADFEVPGVPKPFLERFPDAHPLLGRLIGKTFCRQPGQRFPTEEARGKDPTGFVEVLRTLEICRRTLDHARLDVAAWTSTGMVRSGNEDGVTVLHAVEARQEELRESALVLLADGMGGYEAGEVAAALALQTLRRNLLQQKLFAPLVADAGPPSEELDEHGLPPVAAFDVEICKLVLSLALRDANRAVLAAARQGPKPGQMGCTAEAVYLNGRHFVVGHVGDSRAYHLRRGKLTQVTRDHTLVNRLVELGTLTAAEAERHPRRSELQQAIGGQPDVQPDLYHGMLRPGDWVVVCSDGLSNQMAPEDLQQILEGAASAEAAARRLINFVNRHGAIDNATAVVVRAT